MSSPESELTIMNGNYWTPSVKCKNPNGCVHGSNTPLPYPNPPDATQGQPDWPTEDWRAFLVCQHCGFGSEYTKQDVGWGLAPDLGQWNQNAFLRVELKCAQDNCDSSIRIFRSTHIGETLSYAVQKAVAGSGDARCLEGHNRLSPAKIVVSKKVDIVV